ncbi:MAG: Trk system potassium transporter TrkA [Alphaproteobacteria bacterium]|nr:Trk system potassium transporter TrkA [Alphaproteobacteria bacterium]
MKIIICGAGQVGVGIARRLSSESNDVSIIDSSSTLIDKISDMIDVRGFVGHGSDPDILHQAGAEDVDMIIAVTRHDEVNMVACQVAHSLFRIPTKMARIRSKSYLHGHWSDLFSRKNMPIDVIISPELEVGDVVARRLGLPGASDVLGFCGGEVSVFGVICEEDCPIVNTPLSQLTDLFPDLEAIVVGIVRKNAVFIPNSSTHMLVGDEVYVTAPTSQLKRILSVFGHSEEQAYRVIIAGGGNIGVHVAKRLEESKTQLKIIEFSKERASQIANGLPSTIILHGSALDDQILREANVACTDTLLSLTNDDQVNIMSSILAKRLGCKRTMSLVNNSSYLPFLRSLGIDAHVSPQAVTISKILHHIRRGRILSVHTIHDGQAEILEAESLETSPLLGKSLREMEVFDGVRIGAIWRDGNFIIPCGDTEIQLNDRIVIFAMADKVKHVEQMFRVSFEFF